MTAGLAITSRSRTPSTEEKTWGSRNSSAAPQMGAAPGSKVLELPPQEASAANKITFHRAREQRNRGNKVPARKLGFLMLNEALVVRPCVDIFLFVVRK